jgi:hypothetical protein
MPNKNKFPAITLSVFALTFFMACAIANAQYIQTSNLYVANPPTPWLYVPETLSLPQTSSSPTASITVYQPFSPAIDANRIKVIDYTNSGTGFEVQLQMSDFQAAQNAQNKIPFRNLSIVTLAEAHSPQMLDTAPFNIPPGDDSGSVKVPVPLQHCDWDLNPATFASSCDALFLPVTGNGSGSTPITLIDAPLTTPGVTGRMAQYWMSLGLKLLIPRATPGGTYSSTFTFTLIYPYP